MKEEELTTLDEFTIDYLNSTGIVIYPWNNKNGFEIFIFSGGD